MIVNGYIFIYTIYLVMIDLTVMLLMLVARWLVMYSYELPKYIYIYILCVRHS